jgi:hypothetical protein
MDSTVPLKCKDDTKEHTSAGGPTGSWGCGDVEKAG